jgi:hypothetical protein
MRSRTAPASNRSLVIHRHAVPPRPRTIGTSPGSLSWLRESPATPVRTAHGPGNHGGVTGGPVHQISLVPLLVFSRALPESPLPSLARDPCPGRARDSRHKDEFISSEMLLADRDEDGFNITAALTEREVSLAWTLPFWNDDVVDVPTSM